MREKSFEFSKKGFQQAKDYKQIEMIKKGAYIVIAVYAVTVVYVLTTSSIDSIAFKIITGN